MSLINDALKQTRQMQQQSSPSKPPSLPPVESNRRENPGWLVPGIIVLLLAAGIFAGLSLFKPTPLTANAIPATNSLTVSTVPKPVVVPAVATNVAANTTVVAVTPPTPPEPKLQGILFAATRPCAIVSGQTVFVGDRINEFHVVAISRDRVTLRSKTETRVLSLNPR